MQNITHKVIIMLGDSKVGKSCLLSKLIRNKIELNYKETFGCDFYNYEVTQLDQKVHLSIWDTYGDEEKMPILPTKLYKQAKAFVIVCSYNSFESLNNIKKWTNHIYSYIGNNTNIPILLLINQSDIQQKQFSTEEALEMSKNSDLPNVYSSSIYGNVQSIFSKLCELLLGRSFSFRKSSIISQTTRISLIKASTNIDTRRPTSIGEIEYNIDNVTLGSTQINKLITKNNNIHKKQTSRDISKEKLLNNKSKDSLNQNSNIYTPNNKKEYNDSDIRSVKIVKKSNCCF